MADEKFDKSIDYDDDGKPGTKKDRREFRRNVREFGVGKPTVDTVGRKDLLAMSGIPQEWIDENTEFKKLVNLAIQQGWNKSALGIKRFQDAILNSETYKRHGADMAAYLIAKDKGGADFENLVSDKAAWVEQMAVQMGARLTPEQLRNFGDRALAYGWDEQTLRKVLTGNYTFTDGDGQVHTFDSSMLDYEGGWAATQITEWKNLALANGISYDDGWFESAACGGR